MEQRYSLYAVEKPINKDGKTTFHSFLALINDTYGQKTTLEELHFVHSKRGEFMQASCGVMTCGAEDNKTFLKMITMPAGQSTDIDDCYIWGYIGGSKEHMIDVWNTLIENGLRITEFEIPFSGNVNCRTGTSALLRSIDLDFIPLVPSVGGEYQVWDDKHDAPIKVQHCDFTLG